MEWEWTRTRALAAAWGVELKPLTNRKPSTEAPSGMDLDLKLSAWKARGINVKDVPRSE